MNATPPAKPTKAQAKLISRVRAAGPLVQDNAEDGVRFSLAKGGGVSAATARCCIAQGLLHPVGDGLLEDTTQTFTA
ncbi:hypothetical protein KL86APRO_10458 [uncultured Alphaproteobacteria bacterium]|uniref:Uncharacterized protein n=1 Tax=uncultured Alphaproteobacteria bacterium TaxID=91750 RepID=A0A212J3L3_9PROT|nr:hypothetical protein KL86APRO_10458 [uncultured Alphaproteobacteria bacterium]